MLYRFSIALIAVLMTGCAAKPQAPISFDKHSLDPANGTIGVLVVDLPKTDMRLPGAHCLLCIAVATAANSNLIDHARTLPQDELSSLQEQVAQALRLKGAAVKVIDEKINLQALPTREGQGNNIARKDFSTLHQKYGVEKLMLINIYAIGLEREYSGYIPVGDPKAVLRGVSYMVDLKSNAYTWYAQVNELRSAGKVWDEPPHYPGLTNAYFQVIESGKDAILRGIRN